MLLAHIFCVKPLAHERVQLSPRRAKCTDTKNNGSLLTRWPKRTGDGALLASRCGPFGLGTREHAATSPAAQRPSRRRVALAARNYVDVGTQFRWAASGWAANPAHRRRRENGP